MNALDRFLTAATDRMCEACRHARATDRDGLYCHRIAGTPFPCQVERASSMVEAWLYGACGRDGRFFDPAAVYEAVKAMRTLPVGKAAAVAPRPRDPAQHDQQ